MLPKLFRRRERKSLRRKAARADAPAIIQHFFCLLQRLRKAEGKAESPTSGRRKEIRT